MAYQIGIIFTQRRNNFKKMEKNSTMSILSRYMFQELKKKKLHMNPKKHSEGLVVRVILVLKSRYVDG